MASESRYLVWTLPLTVGLGVVCGLLPSAFNKSNTIGGIQLSSDSLDFGISGLFDSPQAELTITNSQTRETQVSLGADCSCVELSPSTFLLQPAETATVTVSLHRTAAGVAQEGLRNIERELIVNYSLEGARQSKVVALTGKFFEPLLVDESACHFRLRPFEPTEQAIGISAQVDVTKIEVQKVPSWCKSATVRWNDEFHAGHLLVAVDPLSDVSPIDGEVCLAIHYRQNQQELISELCIPINARIHVPVSLDPPMLTIKSGEPKEEVIRFQAAILFREQVDIRIENVTSPWPELDCQILEDKQGFSARYSGAEVSTVDTPVIELQLVLQSQQGDELHLPLRLPVIVL